MSDESTFEVLCSLATAFRKRSYSRACGVYGIMDKCTEQLDGGGGVMSTNCLISLTVYRIYR